MQNLLVSLASIGCLSLSTISLQAQSALAPPVKLSSETIVRLEALMFPPNDPKPKNIAEIENGCTLTAIRNDKNPVEVLQNLLEKADLGRDLEGNETLRESIGPVKLECSEFSMKTFNLNIFIFDPTDVHATFLDDQQINALLDDGEFTKPSITVPPHAGSVGKNGTQTLLSGQL